MLEKEGYMLSLGREEGEEDDVDLDHKDNYDHSDCWEKKICGLIRTKKRMKKTTTIERNVWVNTLNTNALLSIVWIILKLLLKTTMKKKMKHTILARKKL